MEITCIMCPVGCTLKVEKHNSEIAVTGNGCPRGEVYGKNEVTTPKRMVTTIKQYKNGTISLKTSTPINKELVNDCLKTIASTPAPQSVNIGQTFIKNICNTDVDIIVTNINL